MLTGERRASWTWMRDAGTQSRLMSLVWPPPMTMLLAMGDGLICEFSTEAGGDGEYEFVMFDPVARTRWELPDSTDNGERVFCNSYNDDPPVIVTVVDDSDSSFKVFLLDRYFINAPLDAGFFVYESSTDAWRALENPPLEIGIRVGEMRGKDMRDSAVFFQGNLYATFRYYPSNRVLLVNYNLEKNSWREVLALKAGPYDFSADPQLIVSDNRLFMAMWVDESLSTPPGPVFTRPVDYSVYKITEILVAENSSSSVVEISNEDFEKLFGESELFGDTAYGFPLNFNSLVLFSLQSGKLMTYNVRSGYVGALPAHPLEQDAMKRAEEEEELFPAFYAKLMKLSLRNILSGGPAHVHEATASSFSLSASLS